MGTVSKNILTRLVAILTILLVHEARAQNDVTVTTQVKPPYSPYLSDYVGFDNKIVVTLVNTKNTPQSLRLVGQVKGNTGVTVTIPNSYIPAAPISLGPNEVKMVLGTQLKEYLNPDNLQFSGIAKADVVQGNGLPEGDYTFCIQALDYNSGLAKSPPSPSGCANFSITHYEPPTILQPQCGAQVTPKNPQNLLFTWMPPAGAPPNKIEYALKIVEMIPSDVNPNQAMLAATDPPFFETTTQSPSFLYGPAAPTLEIGRSYAFRVTARNKGGNKDLFFKNNGHSVVCSFIYGGQIAEENPQNNQPQEENDQNVDVQEEYADPCTALNCAPQPPPTATPSDKTYQVGDEIQIGYFTLKLTSLSSPSAGALSGEGTIDAPIFKTKLKATFQGLKVNPANKVYQGKAIGAYDPGAQVDEAMRNFTDKVDNIAAEKVKSLSDFVKNNQKYIENFVDVDAQGLPFAWKKALNGKLHLVNIASIEFAPDGARFNAFLDIPIPEANNQLLAFGRKNICFHPTGLSVGGLQKLTMLGADKTFAWGENIDVTLKSADGDAGTYVKWDCEGYKEMQIDGFFTFKNAMLEKAEGKGPVKATFTFSSAASWGDMLGEISMDAFTVKGLKGLKLTFSKVVLDFSDTRNAQNMAFPANYNGGTGNDWRGFYFKEIKAVLPNYLKKSSKPIEITLADAFINKLGFTGAATVQPVFGIGDGNVGGWAFSMEKIEIALLNNSLTKGAFNGALKIPIASTELGYSCLLAGSQDSLKTTFKVENLGDINVDMWGATLAINNGSNISITSNGDNVLVKAVLNGKLTIDKQFADLKGVSVKIPDVTFENFTIQNKAPYLSASLFKFNSPSKFFAGFPVSIKPDSGDGIKLMMTENGTKAGLQLAFHVGLDGNQTSAISGGTVFTLWGKMTENNGKQSWSLAPPTLQKISVSAEVSAVKIIGSIELFKGDTKFGDGFRGMLAVTFKPLLQLKATVQFGSTKYQSNSVYRYWYVDAMATMGAGIPVFPGFGLYGFGGGAYYHMKPESKTPDAANLAGDTAAVANYQQDAAGQSASGVEYVPAPNIAFGFKASIVMGTMPKPNAFNGDLTLEASFFNGGGLNEIALTGHAYFFTPPTPKTRPSASKSLIAIDSLLMKYSHAKKSFDGYMKISFNVKAGNAEILTGGGPTSMHFSKQKWSIKVGTPDDRIDLKVLGMIEVGSYFMIGKKDLPGMPPLPNTEEFPFRNKFPTFNQNNPRDPETADGSGFAFGQQIDINTGKLKFLIFYAQLALTLGYDISVLQQDQTCENINGGKMGLNGWYATGQVYAGIMAAVGIDINLWFLKTQIELFEVKLMAALQAGLPNPTWVQGAVYGEYSALNGLISGSCNFKFKYGDKCDPNAGDEFGGVKVISEIYPKGSNADVFTYPEAIYNLPLNEEIQIVDSSNSDKVVVHRFRFGLKNLEVRNNKTKKPVAGTTSPTQKGRGTLFSPDEMFDSVTSYTATVRIYGDKKEQGVWKRITYNNDPNRERIDSMQSTFTTGSAPETFVNKNIIETTPGRMSRYFTWGDHTEGRIRFNQYPSNIPQAKPKEEDMTYTFMARFQEIGAGSVVIAQTPISWYPESKAIAFPMPNNLKPKTVYIIQIVRRKTPKNPQANAPNKLADNGGGITTTSVSQMYDSATVMNLRKTRLNAITIRDNEFMVYQLAFKTSQFKTMSAKMKNYLQGGPDEVTTGAGDYANTIYARFNGDEPLDWYDTHEGTYTKGKSNVYYIQPIIIPMAKDATTVQGAGLNSSKYWYMLREDYMQYLRIDPMKDDLIHDMTNNEKSNTHTVRSYPPAGAYGAGSRLTTGTNIGVMPFPLYAVGLSYEGTGADWKLTNAEINASYWKGMDDVGFVPTNLALDADNGSGGGGMANHAVNKLQQQIVNRIALRYDVPTVILRDRKLVMSWLNGTCSWYARSTYNWSPEWQTMQRLNTETIDGKANPSYSDLKIRKDKYDVMLLYPGCAPGGDRITIEKK